MVHEIVPGVVLFRPQLGYHFLGRQKTYAIIDSYWKNLNLPWVSPIFHGGRSSIVLGPEGRKKIVFKISFSKPIVLVDTSFMTILRLWGRYERYL